MAFFMPPNYRAGIMTDVPAVYGQTYTPPPPPRQVAPTYQPPAPEEPERWGLSGLKAAATMLSTGDIGQGILTGIDDDQARRELNRRHNIEAEQQAYARHRDQVSDIDRANQEATGDYRYGVERNEHAQDVTREQGNWQKTFDQTAAQNERTNQRADEDAAEKKREFEAGADERTGKARLYNAEAGYYESGGKQGAGKTPLEIQDKDMEDFHYRLGEAAGAVQIGPDGKTFIDPQLYASIGPERMNHADQVFAMVLQDTRNIQVATDAALSSIGISPGSIKQNEQHGWWHQQLWGPNKPAYEIPGDSRSDTPGILQPTPAGKASGPASSVQTMNTPQITGDDDPNYINMPSGTRYIGPDGQPRTKR